MRIVKLEESLEKIVKDAASILSGGGIVLYPTDTLYGLAVDAKNAEAVKKLIELKGRDARKAISVVVRNQETIGMFAEMDELSEKIIAKFLPGALTIVLPATEALTHLSSDGSLGFRIPDDPFTAALSEEFDSPYTATSANISGQPTLANVNEILGQFGEKSELIDLTIDAGERAGGIPSTVVRVLHNKLEILREGRIKREEFNHFKSS